MLPFIPPIDQDLNILAFDPGKHIGFAHLAVKPKQPLAFCYAETLELSVDRLGLFVYELTQRPMHMVFVIEQFRGGVGGEDANRTNEMIGAIKSAVAIGAQHYHIQYNSHRLSAMTKAKNLKQLLNLKIDGHALDAIAHGLAYAMENGYWPG